MKELRSRATAFLRGPCIISEPGRGLLALIRQYVAGEHLDDLESQNQLSLGLRATQTEVARLQGATIGPGRDALLFYERAAAILEGIQAESLTGRV